MALFRRKRAAKDEASVESTSQGSSSTGEQAGQSAAGSTAAAAGSADAPSAGAAGQAQGTGAADGQELGPFDARTLTTRAGLVDLGAILLPGIRGLVVSMEMDQATGNVTAVRVHLGESQLQLQAFAAPKSTGIWDEIRDEIAQALSSQGGSSDLQEGPFGTELVVRVPGRGADGRPVTSAMRFIGIDRPRWFLRGVISGPAAIDEQAARPFIDLLHVTIVDRGDEPMAPRELLPLRLPPEPAAQEGAPGQAAPGQPAPGPGQAAPVRPAQGGSAQGGSAQGAQNTTPQQPAPAQPSTDDLRPFERGPEITEVR